MSDSTPPQTTTLATHISDGRRRCRFIRTGGDQCGGPAMTGHHYCFHHTKNFHPVTHKIQDSPVPFLDDIPSIQLTISRAAQGLFDNTFETSRARTMLYAASVANATLRTQLLQTRLTAGKSQPATESVSDVEFVDSQLLAPDQPYLGPTGKFQPQWSMSKHLYEQECEQAGKPTPQYASEFPPEGWLTLEEIEEQQTDDGARSLMQRYEKKLTELKKHRAAIEAEETKAALAAGLPDPHARPKSTNPKCPFGITWCQGLRHHHHCGFCSGFTKMKLSDARYPGDEAVARVATVREFLQEKKQKEESPRVPPVCPPLADVGIARERDPQEPRDGKTSALRSSATVEWAFIGVPDTPQLRDGVILRPTSPARQIERASAPEPGAPSPVPASNRVPPVCPPLADVGIARERDPEEPRDRKTSALRSSATVEEWALRPTSTTPKNERASAPEEATGSELPVPDPWDDIPDPNFESEPDFDENGECWCGGPNQMFPCHVCRAKKEPGLDLKATADPKGNMQKLLLRKIHKINPCRKPYPQGPIVQGRAAAILSGCASVLKTVVCRSIRSGSARSK